MGYRHLCLFASVLCLAIACSESAPSSPANPEEATAPSPTASANANTAETAAPIAADSATTQSKTPADQTPEQDTLVIPGEQVGPVTPTTSRAELAQYFGEDALQDEAIDIGEGYTEAGTVVHIGADTTFAIIWTDDTQSRPATVKDFGPAWQTPEGIHVGMTYADLQDVLGNFSLYGFGWDYGGTVVLEGSNLANYDGQLILRLAPKPAAVDAAPEALEAVQGDQLFPSDDPNLARLDLTVEQMIVYLNEPAQ